MATGFSPPSASAADSNSRNESSYDTGERAASSSGPSVPDARPALKFIRTDGNLTVPAPAMSVVRNYNEMQYRPTFEHRVPMNVPIPVSSSSDSSGQQARTANVETGSVDEGPIPVASSVVSVPASVVSVQASVVTVRESIVSVSDEPPLPPPAESPPARDLGSPVAGSQGRPVDQISVNSSRSQASVRSAVAKARAEAAMRAAEAAQAHLDYLEAVRMEQCEGYSPDLPCNTMPRAWNDGVSQQPRQDFPGQCHRCLLPATLARLTLMAIPEEVDTLRRHMWQARVEAATQLGMG